jgi:transcriptional regulator with XRE-family HTH domain
MAEQPALGFAGLLRQLRARAKLTQEELADAAGLSPRSISDLERGINRTARKDTAELLAGALGLAEPVRPVAVLRQQTCSQPYAVGPIRAAARHGRDARIWDWCHFRSGTRGFTTAGASWRPSWCSGLWEGWMGRASCW